MADVLKLHFKPVDVLPIGLASTANSDETRDMIFTWADHIIVMQICFVEQIHNKFKGKFDNKILLCDVGSDIYGRSNNPQLIDQVWRWTRINQNKLEIIEHQDKL